MSTVQHESFNIRGQGLRVESVNNRGRSNGRGTGHGQELSPWNNRNGNSKGHSIGSLAVGFPLLEGISKQVSRILHVVEERS